MKNDLCRAVVWAGLLVSGGTLLPRAWAQASPRAGSSATVANKQVASIGDAVRKSGSTAHILYTHGIGSSSAGDSEVLRQSICKYAKRYLKSECTTPAGTLLGRYYANGGEFAADSGVAPDVTYMGSPVWKTPEEWHASAPFVDHWEIRLKNGTRLLVDEINWWPLVLPVKCRNLMPNETNLAGTYDSYFSTCSQRRPHMGDGVAGVRFDSYDWITPGTAAALSKAPNRAVLFNRELKVSILDWNLSDALLGVGPLEAYLVEGIRQLVTNCVETAGSDAGVQYISISHSMGSFLIFSALHPEYAASAAAKGVDKAQRATDLDYLLGHLSQAYFFANQIPLLELAKLGTSRSGKAFVDLESWSQQRGTALGRSATGSGCAGPGSEPLAQIVAWSDPDDLLTWYLGADFQQWQAKSADGRTENGVCVVNNLVKNTTRWFGLIAAPLAAHDNYAKNPRVIRALLEPLQ
jgi:hypothetical protein